MNERTIYIIILFRRNKKIYNINNNILLTNVTGVNEILYNTYVYNIKFL